ncbi:hypothetical protein LL999_00745 [Burkholderia ambifaria]|uniref:hypothetical protein n=1 Tax=Burkholderia ambifaria TaxID=152480 RepID=UPI001E5F0478|nr:hypothetical protein [Burkholderia ambifaria]UEP21533.1 hypothetical protein LL999_00745 [Burkholderia ambifaria]
MLVRSQPGAPNGLIPGTEFPCGVNQLLSLSTRIGCFSIDISPYLDGFPVIVPAAFYGHLPRVHRRLQGNELAQGRWGLLVPKAQTGPFANVLLYSTSYGLFPFCDNSVE